MKELKQESFSHRYIVKIISSILIALLNVIVQLLLPRVLSIEEYGYYSYNLNVFTSVVTVFNLSASDALVSKYSKKNEENGYVLFYLVFFTIVSLILNICVFILFPTKLIHSSFAGQTLCIILLGLNAAIVRKLLTDMVSVFDAMALSRLPAFWQIIQKILITLGVVGSYFAGVLNLFIFYVLQIVTILFVSIILVFLFSYIHKQKYILSVKRLNREYISEFFIFCRPLVFATVFAQIIIIIKNWALMHWGGVASSALFGAAWQLNIVIGYVFSPYAELMKREFAVIHNDEDALRYRINQSLKIMAWLISYFCVFIAVNAADILTILYGNKYSNAILITQLIMLYTIYQAWGQILGSFMIALEQTRASSLISIFVNLFSLVLLYFLQCPNFIWKNGLGVNGMAWSYVISNIFSVTLMLFYITKNIKLNAIKVSFIPIVTIFLCFCLSKLLKILFSIVLIQDDIIHVVFRILCEGIIYSGILLGILYKFPNIFGLNKDMIVQKFPFLIRIIK